MKPPFSHGFPMAFCGFPKAQPVQVFDVPGPLDLALSAASAAASSLRKGAAYAVQGRAGRFGYKSYYVCMIQLF